MALWSGLAVIIGVGAEYLLPAMGDVGIWNWPGAAVAFGVAGEVAFARRGSKLTGVISDRLKERLRKATEDVEAAQILAISAQGEAASASGRADKALRDLKKAIERAAKTELETERLKSLTAWRQLNHEEHTALRLSLKNSGPGASVRFCVLVNDQESLSFAYRISAPFRAAGWTVGFRFSAYTHDIMTGILVPVPNDGWFDEMKVVNGRVRDAFIAAGIGFTNGWPLEPFMYTDDNALLTETLAWVYVGPKPMPPI